MKPSARISLLCRDLRKNARIKNRPRSRSFLQLESGQISLIPAQDVRWFSLAMFLQSHEDLQKLELTIVHGYTIVKQLPIIHYTLPIGIPH